jgi:hypothetical protein
VIFISIHSVIICVVFFGTYMRCTRLYPLNPGVTIYCCTVSTTPLRVFFHSDWYTHEAPTSSHIPSFLCSSAFSQEEFSYRGELFFLPLFVLDEFICEQGGEILRFSGSSITGRDFEISWFLYRGGQIWSFGLPLIQGGEMC